MNVFKSAAVTFAVTAVLPLAGCGGSAPTSQSGGGDTVNVSTWGGVWTDAEKKYFGDPFTAETGIKINYQASSSSPMAPALLQAQSGKVDLDVIFAEHADILRSKNLLTKFPDDLMQDLKANARPDAFEDDLVKIGTTATIIACNPTIMKRCPTNPQEFWDVANFPGPRAFVNDPDTAMPMALVADGVPQKDVYPIDIDRAMKKLDQIKPDIKVWPTSGSDQQQVLNNKEVGAAIMWNGRAFVVKRDVIPQLELFWDGSFRTDSDGLVVMAKAPHKDAAFRYIKWIIDHPQNQAQWTEALTYPTPTKQLDTLVPPDIADALPASHPQNMPLNDQWILEHNTDIQKAWQEFLAG